MTLRCRTVESASAATPCRMAYPANNTSSLVSSYGRWEMSAC
ncbi:MAG TPA: hypothetical protein PKH61_08220 [Microbacteriaceae bacterium]|nr:hypothetical protein [Microbacteriaceae bacterium]HPZ33976.1 hypothetical protein [Microbacteriaceae bacterium]